MLRVVFDTVVFVRALVTPRSFWGKLIVDHARQYRLFVSRPVLEEYLDVLSRPELTSRFRTLAGLDRVAVLDIVAQAEVVELQPIPRTSRDPKDDKFLATAVAAGADDLVTEDQDLLVLEHYQTTRIIDGRTFLGLLERERERGRP